MNERDLETAVLRALDAAAELGGRPVDPEKPLVEQFDLDESRFFSALARETGLEVPPGHRARLTSLGGILKYLGRRMSG